MVLLNHMQAVPKPFVCGFRAVDSGEPAEAGTRDGARQRRLAAQLQRKLDQHRMSNRPFLICRMDPADPHGDASLLDAFAAEVRILRRSRIGHSAGSGMATSLQDDPAAVAGRHTRLLRAHATLAWVSQCAAGRLRCASYTAAEPVRPPDSLHVRIFVMLCRFSCAAFNLWRPVPTQTQRCSRRQPAGMKQQVVCVGCAAATHMSPAADAAGSRLIDEPAFRHNLVAAHERITGPRMLVSG